jgi:hypothetical protein
VAVPKYWRVIGVFRANGEVVSRDFINFGNTYYNIEPAQFACGTSTTFASVSLANVVPPETVSMDALILTKSDGTRRNEYRPAYPNNTPAYDTMSYGAYYDSTLRTAVIGWIPIVGSRAILYKTDNNANTVTSFVAGYRVSFR